MVTLSKVKEAHEKCGASQAICANYLKKTNGNVEAAIALMRKKGLCK